MFLQFLKMGSLLSIGYIFMNSIPKNWQILPCAHALHSRQSFHFQKIIGILKKKKLSCRTLPFTSKNNYQKENSIL